MRLSFLYLALAMLAGLAFGACVRPQITPIASNVPSPSPTQAILPTATAVPPRPTPSAMPVSSLAPTPTATLVTSPRSSVTPRSVLSACPADIGQALFSVLPMQLDQFLAFRPLGWTSPPSNVFPTKHSSFALALPGQEPPRYPVLFPGDIWVTQVNSTEWASGKTGYQVYFQPCQEFTAYFYHLSSLSERLLAELDGGEKSCRSYDAGGGMVRLCMVRTHVRVQGGELAGLSGDAAGVDFGAVDYRTPPLAFADPSHYTLELLHYVSPVLYFSPEMRQALEGKLSSYDGKVVRTAEPRVGLIAQDVVGTAQGNWFSTGLHWAMSPPPNPDPFIALVHDYVDPAQPLFSIGGLAVPGLGQGVYSVAPLAEGKVNRDFTAVSPDGTVYCYDRFLTGKTTGGIGLSKPGGVLVISMPDAKTLLVEKQGNAGATCASLAPWRLTEAATSFTR